MRLSLSFLFFFISVLCLTAYGSNTPEKRVRAHRHAENIKIDGKLDEEAWKYAEKASGFIQREPIPGAPATFDTEVYFLYDDYAVYIGARMYDPEPEKILKELTIRDQVGNTDNFSVFFDAYKSGLHGFLFTVTASNVQSEFVVTNHEDDASWNAVWDSQVYIDGSGWYAEIKIPYFSLRFPTAEIQEWKVQYQREIRRFREYSTWRAIDPLVNGWVQQSGTVENIRNIKSPFRLSLTPYLSGYVNTTHTPRSNQPASVSTAYSAGLDLKYGINDAFTLDMTLIPDFGQVISDRQVLNLTPFEVFFEENRQFFTEGTELFNRGRLFYSRRVGGRPLHYYDAYRQLKPGEKITDNPEVAQLYNATKISGRTAQGTGLGFFNAIVGEEYATIEDAEGNSRKYRTNPRTNYNALVVDQNLKNNSFVSIMNTNVWREGADYDANVTGAFFNFKTKDQNYYTEGNAVVAQRIFPDKNDVGHSYNVGIGKAGGQWTYDIWHGLESPNYNPNDMGFLMSPNEQYFYLGGGYAEFSPENPKLQLYRFRVESNYSRLVHPNVFTDFNISMNSFVLYKSRFAFGINGRIEPVPTYDYFEPRTSDFSIGLAWPQNYMLGGFISSDYRKAFAYDVNLSHRIFNAEGRTTTSLSLGPRFRFSDQFSMFQSLNISWLQNEPGYVNRWLAGEALEDIPSHRILMGIRDRLVTDHSITARYIFNSLMGVNLRIRHYWDRVMHDGFGLLEQDGYLTAIDYDGRNDKGKAIFDRNVNIFNIDLQYNWRFAPGSDIIFVWKNQIFNSDDQYQRNYFGNLGGLFDAVQGNSFSVRVLYFLDYNQLRSNKA